MKVVITIEDKRGRDDASVLVEFSPKVTKRTKSTAALRVVEIILAALKQGASKMVVSGD